jgi:protein-tyrosine-phosphatase
VVTTRRNAVGFGMLGLAIGYFAWYTPYAGLTKALSSGLLPGMDARVGGLVLLPAAALGTLAGSLIFLGASGWWRYAGRGRLGRREVVRPGRAAVTAGFFMALIIATTTLNYTFAGVSILFMLLMMRGGVLVLSPLVDAARRRPVRVYSWVALGLSLLAVTAALSDVDSYHLTIAAVVSLGVYLFGYIGRFEIMSRVAKTGDQAIDRGYLVEEQISAALWQVGLCALAAAVGFGPVFGALREGFTSFLLTPAVIPAFAVGLLYEALFIYGTLIYLDPREYTWCVPANRGASLLSGLVASYGLAWLTGLATPGAGQLAGTAFIVLAGLALSYPALREAAARRWAWARRRRVLFVCGGNTGRSAMAEAIARADANGTWSPRSAGLAPRVSGAPMAAPAVAALRQMGVPPRRHRTRQLTRQMCRDADAVFCMTRAQRTAVEQLAPEARGRTFCLDPARDIPDPASAPDPGAAYLRTALVLREQVRARLREPMARLQPQAGG